jgi:endopeptidase La
MGTETTLRDFLIHYSQNEYLKRSNIIRALSLHIEELHKNYLINGSERTKTLKIINDLINTLNSTYNERMKMLKENDTDSNEYMSDDSEMTTAKNLKKIPDVDCKLSELTHFPEQLHSYDNFDVIDSLMNSSSHIFSDDFYSVLPNDFAKIDDTILNIMYDYGASNIKDILKVLARYKNINECIKAELFEFTNVISTLFVPIFVKKINVNESNGGELKRVEVVPEKYEILLDNFFSVDVNFVFYGKTKSEIAVSVYGYFPNDPTNSVIRTSQICNKYVYEKKKYYTKLCSEPTLLKKKVGLKLFNKFDLIPDEFKFLFVKNISVGHLLAWNEVSFIEDLVTDYSIFNVYATSKNFKMVFSDFVQSETMIKFKIIKYLLLGTNSKDAAMLFNLMKESKFGSVLVSDVMYNNLSLHLQTKLTKADISIKTELKKLNKMNTDDVDLKTQIALNKNMPAKVKKHALEKLNELKSGNNEYYKYLTYVKTLVDYPWTGDGDGDIFEIYKTNKPKWKTIMEDTHNKMEKKVYGHKESKETIVELLGKWFSNHKSLGKAIGLLGPPGVGKTLLAKELGNALGIPLVKINLGGMEDAAILSGHSITYSGAVPGLIVKKMVEAGKSRCILFFDELDKTCYHHGVNEIFDVLIHVTDQTTNAEFNDKFFQDIAFPLNKALFVFSFNDKSKVDPILLDRMEIINVKAYTVDDKIKIVNDYLLKEVKDDFGFDLNVKISNETIEYLINNFTHEAGVRSIKRKIEKLFLKMNKDRIFESGPFENFKSDTIEITKELVDRYLNKPNMLIKKVGNLPEIGTINGLYATSLGDGGIIPILIYKLQTGKSNKFSFQLTGKQGTVMKESVSFAYTIASNLIKPELVNDFLDEHPCGLHIHTPDGATPKDGPSAGSAFTLGFISKILGKRIKNDVGITGEIERRGCITAIGGLEYKLPGAKSAGVKLVFVPKENEKDIIKLKESDPKLFDNNFKCELVNHISDVLDLALIEDENLIYTDDMVYEKLFDSTKFVLPIEKIEKNIKKPNKINKIPIIIESDDEQEENNNDCDSCDEDDNNSESDMSK